MTAIAIAALVIAALLFVGWRFERAWSRQRDRQFAIEERRLALEERKLDLPAVAPVPEIPEGLLRMAEMETEDWAKEQVKQRMRELYADCGSWDTVALLMTQELHRDGPAGSA